MKIRTISAASIALALCLGGAALPAFATDEEECVPRDAYSETIPGTPGVDAVYETVVISEAGWQRYSYTGNWDYDEAPPFPSDDWQANVAGDPHGVGVESAYFRSHGNSGSGDWFYLEAVAEVTEERLVSEAIPATDPITTDYPAIVCEPIVVTPPTTPATVVVPQVADTLAYTGAGDVTPHLWVSGLIALLAGLTIVVTQARMRRAVRMVSSK